MPNVTGKVKYVLDSYAVIAYLEAESGGSRIKELLESSDSNNPHCFMCVVNLGEVLYIVEREKSLFHAQQVASNINDLPLEIIDADRSLTLAAAHLKARFPVAYADCFAAALARTKNAVLVTGDSEFRKIEADCGLRIEWLVSQ